MIFGSEIFDLLDQLLLRMLDMDLVDALGGLNSCRTSLAWLLTIALRIVSLDPSSKVRSSM